MPRHLRLRVQPLERRETPDSTPHTVAVSNFYQNWNNNALITMNDDWAGVPSVIGYLGDDTIGEGVDPQTLLTPYSTVDVIANQGSNTALTIGGVAEFDGFSNRVIALQADATADAPNLVVSINTTGRANISISYNLRDIDGTTDNAIQPVALQYRLGNAGNFVNLPSGFVTDATTGPSLANKVTAVNVTFPSAVDNQSLVEIRIITTNAVGNDEWVGVDNIVVGAKEFAVNTYTSNNQLSASVAVDADGDAFVVWTSNGQDGSGFGIFGQRFDAAGMKVGGEFQVNTYTGLEQQSAAVAVDADGDAIVVWISDSQDGFGFGIYGQRFASTGAKVGDEFQVNTYTLGNQAGVSVAMDADGDAAVVWQSNGQDGSYYGVYGQRFNAAGAKVGGEFQVNTFTANSQDLPALAMDADGDAIVIWSSEQDGNGRGVFGQRFNSAGAKVGGEFQVNTFTTGNQTLPSVTVDADGDAMVVWYSVGQDGSGYGVYGQRFSSAGAKVGGEFRINTFTTSDQFVPSVAMDADGDALVVWQSYQQDGGENGVYGQRFDSAGDKVGGEFQINTYTTSFQGRPRVAVDVDGDAVGVWSSAGQDGNGQGIFGQRFRSPNSPPPTKLTNIEVNASVPGPQRSLVTSLKLSFDSPVSFTGSPSTAFTLVNQATTNPVTLAAAVDGTGTVVTLTFTGGSIDLGGSLADGRYTLTILGNQFTGNGFDGNGDGIPGGNYTMIGTPANGLFRLFGDADGNGSVTATDFNAFRLVYGTTGPSFFDFNGNNQVTAADFNEFRLRYGSMVP